MYTIGFELIKGYKEDSRQCNALAVMEAAFKAKDNTEAAVESIFHNFASFSHLYADWR